MGARTIRRRAGDCGGFRPAPPSCSAPIPPVTAGRVLVVDDDPNIRSMLERGLRYEGFSVDLSPDGETAVDALRRSSPDLVILDILLPGIDGLEVCRRVRAQGRARPAAEHTAPSCGGGPAGCRSRTGCEQSKCVQSLLRERCTADRDQRQQKILHSRPAPQ